MSSDYPSDILNSFQNTMDHIVKARLCETFINDGENKTNKTTPPVPHKSVPPASRAAEKTAYHDMRKSSRLTMGIIGCLPDNVQQAIRSFSIRPDKQHITVAFPFMASRLLEFTETTPSARLNTVDALYTDTGPEIIDGFVFIVTMVPDKQKLGMTVVLFTLVEVGTTEGIVKHFESLIKILLHTNTTISTWKFPLCVVDFDPPMLDTIVDTCTTSILDIQFENLQMTFANKSKTDMYQYVKERIVLPNMCSYTQHYTATLQGTVGAVGFTDPEFFISVTEHLRSYRCTMSDYQKVDCMLKASTTDYAVRQWWGVWGHQQISRKIFPVCSTTRNQKNSQHMVTSCSSLLDGFTNITIKEGLHSIIKGLKLQEIPLTGCVGRETLYRRTTTKQFHSLNANNDSNLFDLKETYSAFHRPQPRSLKVTSSFTPYSDALKAAAENPSRNKMTSNLVHHVGQANTYATGTKSSHISAPYWVNCMIGKYVQSVRHRPPGKTVVYKPQVLAYEVTSTSGDT